MKALTLLLILLCASRLHCQTTDLDDIDVKIQNTLGQEMTRNADLSWLTPEIRPIVTARLMKSLQFSDMSVSEPTRTEYVEKKLVSMGDAETIQKLISLMQVDGRRTALESAATEECLPYLASALRNAALGPVPAESGSDVRPQSARDRFAYLALKIIASRESFPREVREWAWRLHETLESPSKEKKVDLLNQWWEKNQTAILEKRYEDATWLPQYKGHVSYMGEEEVRESNADPELHRADRKARPGVTIGENMTTVASEPRSWQLWTSLGAFAIMGIAFLRWKLTQKPT